MSLQPTGKTGVLPAALLAAAAAFLVCPTGAVLATGPAGPEAPGTQSPAALARPDSPASSPLLLVPPEDRFGRPRIEALAAHPEIDRVVFFLDDDPIGSDDRRPYRLKLDLPSHNPAAEPWTLRAVAYDRDGSVVGEDALELLDSGDGLREASGSSAASPEARSPVFDVSIDEIRGDPAAGAVDVAVRLSLPDDGRLREVALFLNETRAERFFAPEEPPAGADLRTRIETPNARPGDYLRVVARLDDGRSLEDARPLFGNASADRLDVCLVDLFAVVSNRWGEPVLGLSAEDFRVRTDERELPLERFHEASEVPLALGLLVDSSESMRLIMDETKEAAQRFLERTLIPGDEAFLVDVGTVPRLVHEMSPSPAELAGAFEDLEPGGSTALYDAILLGLLRLERHPGRRALVVLTDGHDFGSDFGPRRCRRHAADAGVPIYVVSLAGMPRDRGRPERNYRLEALARSTGGRVLHVDRLEGIDRAYRAIDRELRSQYVLGLSSDRILSADELSALEVEVLRPGLEVRTARSADR